jgi:soluble lytic murein transglycosylase-like protein
MRIHLWQYYLLTFFSACFFFTVFHAVAQAQTISAPPPPSIGEPAFSDQSVLFSPTPSTPLSGAAWPTVTPTMTVAPTAIPTATPKLIPTIVTSSDLETLFAKYGSEYNVDPNWLKKIARCESNFNPQADTGLYAGMFQFMAQTWSSTRNSMGLDPNPDLRKNAEESIRTAAFMLSRGRENSWPVCK